jgi:hypothetical protein
MPPEPPQFCDYCCPHAEFPPADSEGLCRTMAAVYCRRLRRLVHKNLPCAWRAGGGKP